MGNVVLGQKEHPPGPPEGTRASELCHVPALCSTQTPGSQLLQGWKPGWGTGGGG